MSKKQLKAQASQKNLLRASLYLEGMKILAKMAGLPDAPIIEPVKLNAPNLPLEDAELEHYFKFQDTPQGRMSKKQFERELESKYRKGSRVNETAGEV